MIPLKHLALAAAFALLCAKQTPLTTVHAKKKAFARATRSALTPRAFAHRQRPSNTLVACVAKRNAAPNSNVLLSSPNKRCAFHSSSKHLDPKRTNDFLRRMQAKLKEKKDARPGQNTSASSSRTQGSGGAGWGVLANVVIGIFFLPVVKTFLEKDLLLNYAREEGTPYSINERQELGKAFTTGIHCFSWGCIKNWNCPSVETDVLKVFNRLPILDKEEGKKKLNAIDLTADEARRCKLVITATGEIVDSGELNLEEHWNSVEYIGVVSEGFEEGTRVAWKVDGKPIGKLLSKKETRGGEPGWRVRKPNGAVAVEVFLK